MKIFSLKNLIAVTILFICAIIVAVSCKKPKTDCTVVITVKKLYPDTNETVGFAKVIIAPDYPDVRVQGLSDAGGQYSYVFKYEGILDVLASKKLAGTPDSLFGKGVVRLIPGETSYKTIFVN